MSGRGAKERRLQARRDRFRDGLSVRESARQIKELERENPAFGKTVNLQTAARRDGTGTWRRI